MISGNWKFSPVSRTITDMKRTLTLDSTRAVGERITASGWVHARRDHGGLIFVDLRDHAGLLPKQRAESRIEFLQIYFVGQFVEWVRLV